MPVAAETAAGAKNTSWPSGALPCVAISVIATSLLPIASAATTGLASQRVGSPVKQTV
ncbi:MAG: hypothetical protein ACTHK2_05760 [Dokdonella sp.]|uniref:hypothetical protein n=1 Tax=Dokdonella sp. TaxID=2291710 RepID=UPI003F7E0E5F